MDPVVLYTDYSGDLTCRQCVPDQNRPLFRSRIVGGPPIVQTASKYSEGQFRLLLYGDSYLTAFSVDDLLSNPPSRENLIPSAGSESCSPLWHHTVTRGKALGALTAEFGPTSDIILTSSSSSGVAISDIRIAERHVLSALMPPDIEAYKWQLSKHTHVPDKSLTGAAFSRGFQNIVALTYELALVWDMRYTAAPRLMHELPTPDEGDRFMTVHISKAATKDPEDWTPMWLCTERGQLYLVNFDSAERRDGSSSQFPSLESADEIISSETSSNVDNVTSTYIELPHDSFIVSVCMPHPYERDVFFTGNSRGWIQCWDAKKIWSEGCNSQPSTLLGHQKWVRSLDVSRDGETLVSGGSDGCIKFWDSKSASGVFDLAPLGEHHQEEHMKTGILHCLLVD